MENKKIFFGSFIFVSIILLITACQASDLTSFIRDRKHTLSTSQDLSSLISAASNNNRLVLLGEASHGTHEYYAWRDSISRRLISESAFSFIAVEGDFASLYELNRYVKNKPGAASSAREVLEGLNRWPLWMWANEETVALAEWLRQYNDNLTQGSQKVGFYGMDVYDEWTSKRAVLDILKATNNDLYDQVSDLYACFAPFQRDSWNYARALQQGIKQTCSDATAAVVKLIEESEVLINNLSKEEYFYLLQNARVKKNAEKFFRKSATRQDASSWNARVHHMHHTVNYLLRFYGNDSKGIVWAHNTHVGDARFTEMFQAGNQNIGELSRSEHGPENVFAIGFTTFKGRVKAGASWGANIQEMSIDAARRNSIEYELNQIGERSFFLIFDDLDRSHPSFVEPMGHRAVGVVFNPANERFQYVNSIIPLRYDALIFFRETSALHPLHP